MKRIDFENGTITQNILGAALPMLVAQILNLLYNIVDRIYIARIPQVGTAALGAVGLCFPLIVIISAFANLFGSGGAPLFSIYRGKKQLPEAESVMNTSFTMLCACGAALMALGLLFARPLLAAFGASDDAMRYALPYLQLYLIGTLPSMVAVGMNPFINAQGYSTIGMLTVAIGAVANLLLDPLFIFAFGFGVCGAAIATVLSQCLSAGFVLFFLMGKAELRVRLLHRNEAARCAGYAKSIVSLGTAGFIMQLTNSLVTICANSVLAVTGGDIYISVMTIVSSVRQLVETPIYAINEGSSPILSYNYGARRAAKGAQGGRCDERFDFRVHGGDVGHHSAAAGQADPGVQLGRCAGGGLCSDAEIVLCGVYFYGSAIHRPDGFQIAEQKAAGDLLLAAAKGFHRRAAYLSAALCLRAGDGRRFYRRACLQRHWGQPVFFLSCCAPSCRS